jgi:RNA polymerase sigma factor (sigma-70 family)
MPTSPMSDVIRYLHSALLLPEGVDLTDGQLLECFVSRRELTALGALVRRHGPMVWGVCRRVLGNHHDAEDAFQAAFLVLVRKAASIDPPAMVGSWLYGVAHQTALKARATRAKRRVRERPETRMPEPAVIESDLWSDLQPLLDREMIGLPEKYRAVIVLCELEGKTGKEAARQLGLPEGTVASRLARGRTMLAKRLARHGLAVSGGALADVLSHKAASAGVPSSVMTSTIKTVTLVAAGQTAAGAISLETAALTEGMLKAMLLTKLKSMTAMLLVSAVIFGGILFAQQMLDQGAAEPKPAAADPEKSTATAPAKDLPLEYPLGDVSRWLPRLKSFHLRAECRYEHGPDDIARNLREIKSQYPDLKDPDPLFFTQLLPVLDVVAECDFDQSRLRSFNLLRTAEKLELSSDLRIWDGKRALMHNQYFRSNQNDFRLAPKPEQVAESLYRDVTYLGRQPPVFWWNNTPEAKKEFEQSSGTPADYVLVGRELYHGVECDVLLRSVGHPDRYYVGVKDGRWYGAKEGIIAIPANLSEAHQLAVEEFLGKKLGENVSDSAWEEIENTLRSLPQDKKAAWCRLHYSRVARNYIPVFEYWFSDFRDLGNGRVFPYREEFLFHDHEGQEKIFVRSKLTITIKEINIDRPLEDRLFQEPLTEGAMISDDIQQPPLYYKHKAKFTPEEWQGIVKKAKDRHDKDNAHRRKVELLIGKPAPPLPAGEWLNSEPLTWADLRGKIVVLKFWSIGCAPCYSELSALSGPDTKDTGAEEPVEKASQIPIVFIGVHSPGSRAEIEEVVNKYKLGAPICIDRKGAETSWGEFFEQCEIFGIPTSVAVDEKGRILAHGSFSEVIIAASQHRNEISEKK